MIWNMKRILLYIFVFIPVVLSAQTELEMFLSQRDSLQKSYIGRPFSEFRAITLDGKIITDKSLRGKVTIMNFWIQGCAPCMAEFEALSELYYKYKDNPEFQFLSFSHNPVEIVEKVVEANQLPFMVCLVSEEKCNRLINGSGFPVNIIVDRSGRIIYYKTGGYTAKKKVKEALKPMEELVAESLKGIRRPGKITMRN
jgi:Thiol-disulfide isomerase and thioredoxins